MAGQSVLQQDHLGKGGHPDLQASDDDSVRGIHGHGTRGNIS